MAKTPVSAHSPVVAWRGPFALPGVLPGALTRSLLIVVLCWGTLAASTSAFAQPAPGRLDAEERQRLRHELREQWREGRARGPRESIAEPAPVQPDGWAPGSRLTPEERQLLRRQVREARGRND